MVEFQLLDHKRPKLGAEEVARSGAPSELQFLQSIAVVRSWTPKDRKGHTPAGQQVLITPENRRSLSSV
jgi:hypothetical protein